MRTITEDICAVKLCKSGPREPRVRKVRLVVLRWILHEALDQYKIEGIASTLEAEYAVSDEGHAARQPVADREQPFLMLEDFGMLEQDAAEANDRLDQGELQDVNVQQDWAARPLPEEASDADEEEEHQEEAEPEREEAPRQRRQKRRRPEEAQEDAGPDIAAAVLVPEPEPPQAELPIFDSGGWHFRARADNTPVGRLHHLGDSSLKATCKLHKQCACAISLPPAGSTRARQVVEALGHLPTFADVERSLRGWLADGLTCDAANHTTASVRLKSEQWFMKTRSRQAGSCPVFRWIQDRGLRIWEALCYGYMYG